MPASLLAHLTIITLLELGDVTEKTIFFKIHFVEYKQILGDYDSALYESEDFTGVTLQDFPIRGKLIMNYL